MPIVYLSPSTREFNVYPGGGNEEYYMNLIVDEMIPYLNSSGIKYERCIPSQPITSAIAQANRSNHDLYMAIQSGSSSDSKTKQIRESNVLYKPGDPESKRISDIVAQNLKGIYPLPDKVKTASKNHRVELQDVIAPSVIIEVAHHDNPDDAMWIRENTEKIAELLSSSIAEYFSVPLITPQEAIQTTTPSEINLYIRPSLTSPVVSSVPSGASVLILGEWENWYVIDYLGNIGYTEKFSIDE